MNFIDTSLVHRLSFFGQFLKSDNKDSLQELKACILSRDVRKTLCVNVYGAVDSLQVKDFIADLSQYMSSSMYLQATKPLEEVINITSPTLICTTWDVEECQEKLKEKDLKKVFLVHIIDVGKRSDRRVMNDSLDDIENTSVIHEAQNPSCTLSVGAGNNTAQNAKNMRCEIHEILYYNGTSNCNVYFIKQFENFVADGLIK